MLKVQEIREIIKLIDESSIEEFTYETNGSKIAMKKSNDSTNAEQIKNQVESIVQQSAGVSKQETIVVSEEKQAVQVDEAQPIPEQTIDYDYEITSPMVGTLYSAPSPESEPYVKVGSKVTEDSIVCIVEAMKLFNEIEGEVSGEIVEILVEDGELVEYGQPLFRVKK